MSASLMRAAPRRQPAITFAGLLIGLKFPGLGRWEMEERTRLENRLRKVRLYRERAVRMRDLATREKDQALKHALLALAEEYDAFCEKVVGGAAPSMPSIPEAAAPSRI